MESGHLHIIYGKCTFAHQMPRAVCVILCLLYTCIQAPSIKYMPVTVAHDIHAVGIRARFGWEGFLEEVSLGGGGGGKRGSFKRR